MKIRYYFALWMAKLSIVALRITKHNGTNFPGQLAIKLCPDFLKYIDKPKKIIGITGTNGKTTCSNMIIDALANGGVETLNNSYGSNIHFGIATSLIKGVGGGGKCKYDTAVLEIDERATPRIFPYIQPDILLVTNLFRDSMKRNAHPEYIKWILEENIPEKSKLILNADDLISSDMNLPNDRVFFGIEEMDTDIKECKNIINDLRVCPKCGHKLKYEYLRYHHIGKAYCENCGFRSHDYDYYGKDVDVRNETIVIGDHTGEHKYKLISDAIHNIYNMVAMVSLLRELGYSFDQIEKMIEGVSVVSSRYSKELCGKVFVANQMAKENNALGSSRAFDYVSSQSGPKELVLMMNCLGDQKTWSENTCWLYDCDFELLNDPEIEHIVVTGPRGKDYHLRLLMAGVPEEKISWTLNEIDAPDLLHYKPGESIYIFYGTDSINLGEKVLNKTKEIARKRG